MYNDVYTFYTTKPLYVIVRTTYILYMTTYL